MTNLDKKILNQGLRKGRIRAKISGTNDRPRLSVSVSNMHVSAQIIDDVKNIQLYQVQLSEQKSPAQLLSKLHMLDLI